MNRLFILHVGAETDLFRPVDVSRLKKPYQVLFYGSFLKLQGAETIVAAAKQVSDLDITWTLLGEGDLKTECMKMAHGQDNIRFEPWVNYQQLPHRISQAHVLLGIFGTTVKADLVIPNKIFQAMAMGRAVITRKAKAYERTLDESETIGWVPPGDPSALAFLVRKWFEDPSHLMARSRKTRRLFDTFFSEPILQSALQKIMEASLLKKRKA
jgi:glycosyltransferase involved in cell wall biosynthesis